MIGTVGGILGDGGTDKSLELDVLRAVVSAGSLVKISISISVYQYHPELGTELLMSP